MPSCPAMGTTCISVTRGVRYAVLMGSPYEPATMRVQH
jgi:hypothetical protein